MSIIFVTGASRGFGASVSVELSRALPADPTVVLFSRDVHALGHTRARVLAASPRATVLSVCADAGDAESLADAWRTAVAGLPVDAVFARAVLVHNAGDTAPLGYVRDLARAPDAVSALRAAFELNVTSPVLLSSLFLDFCASPRCAAAGAGAPPHAFVNVSSLAAVQPFASMGIYSIGKAARDMLTSVVGVEHADGSAGGVGVRVKALSYAPGPMDTALQAATRSNAALHPPTASFFNSLDEAGTWVDVDVSAAKCAGLIAADTFVTGAHIDYYDV
jgi:sepiapterin reductase